MMESEATARIYRRKKRLFWAAILLVGILLVPPVAAFVEREQSFFSFVFLAVESGVCFIGGLAAMIIYLVIDKKKKLSSLKIIGPEVIIREVSPWTHVIFGGVLFVPLFSLAAALVVDDKATATWAGISRFSWFLLGFSLMVLVPAIFSSIKYTRAMNRVMAGDYKVYLAELTRKEEKLVDIGDSESSTYTSDYELWFEKREDERYTDYRVSERAYQEAKPGDLYYLLVVGKEILKAVPVDQCVLADECRDRLIREH